MAGLRRDAYPYMQSTNPFHLSTTSAQHPRGRLKVRAVLEPECDPRFGGDPPLTTVESPGHVQRPLLFDPHGDQWLSKRAVRSELSFLPDPELAGAITWDDDLTERLTTRCRRSSCQWLCKPGLPVRRLLRPTSLSMDSG